MSNERAGIFFLTVILSTLLLLVYAYFVGVPIEEASHAMAQLMCAALHITCAP
jgi:hypothetical protein